MLWRQQNGDFAVLPQAGQAGPDRTGLNRLGRCRSRPLREGRSCRPESGNGASASTATAPKCRARAIVSSIARWARMSFEGMLEIALVYGPLDQDPGPEGAIRVGAAPIGEDDRQGDLALAEVVADVLAELGRAAAIVERIIDQLKSEAEIAAVGAERRARGAVASADRRADFSRRGKERRGLGADHRQILVLGGRGILGGGELHDFAFRNHRGGMRTGCRGRRATRPRPSS